MGERVVMVLSNDCVSDPRVEKEARVLASSGREVTIVAWDRSGAAPAREKRDGFVIERVGPQAAYGAGLRSLPLFARFWANATSRVLELEPDVVHCHDLDTAVVGMRVRNRRDAVKVVLDFHELYRDASMVPQKGLVGIVARTLVDVLERRAVAHAALVFVANPGTMDHYQMLAGSRARAIPNAPDAEMFRPAESRPERLFTVGYIGSKRYVKGLLALIDIVGRHEDMAALLAGGGVAERAVAQAAAGNGRIEVSGAFTYDETPSLYRRIDVSWVLYDAHLGNVRTSFPVKVMESMACGLPVIVYSGTWTGDFVERNGVGIAIDPDDPASGEEALLRLKDEPGLARAMGRRGRELIERELSWQHVSGTIVNAYETLTASG
ncbi:MAG: glycosyltransferase family 4 protein [Actinomycetia bacterium]|nr:glycosyltransferase family 4 protein [Actinomycetes bacterium]